METLPNLTKSKGYTYPKTNEYSISYDPSL